MPCLNDLHISTHGIRINFLKSYITMWLSSWIYTHYNTIRKVIDISMLYKV